MSDFQFEAKRQSLINALTSFDPQSSQITNAVELFMSTLSRGGTVYTCGNGGSAAEALHLTEELVGRYKRDRNPLRAICLNADVTLLTCIANDFGYEHIYERQIKCFCTKNDLLIVLSTSGKSNNIIKAVESARLLGVPCIIFGGNTNTYPKFDTAVSITFDTDDHATIQEMHLVMIHYLLDLVDQN